MAALSFSPGFLRDEAGKTEESRSGTASELWGTMRRVVSSIAYAMLFGGCHNANQGPSLAIFAVGQIRAGGVITEQFRVTQSAASNERVTVQYATADGSAVADRDYRPASGALTFPANNSAPQTLDITLIGTAHDSPRIFSVTLSHPVNAVITRASATAILAGTAAP
jgi:Calx-beta domain